MFLIRIYHITDTPQCGVLSVGGGDRTGGRQQQQCTGTRNGARGLSRTKREERIPKEIKANRKRRAEAMDPGAGVLRGVSGPERCASGRRAVDDVVDRLVVAAVQVGFPRKGIAGESEEGQGGADQE